MNIKDEITFTQNCLESKQRELAVLIQAEQMLRGIDLSAVNYCAVYAYEGSTPEFRLTLSEDRKNDRLAAKLARRFRVKFEKEKSWSGDYFNVSAEVQGIRFTVAGYVPTTCRFVETETPISEEEYQRRVEAAISSVKKVQVHRELVCK